MTRKVEIAMLLLLLALSPCLSGQVFKASFTTGVGTYRMQNLKTYLETVNESLPFSPEIVDAFPPYLWYATSFAIRLDDFHAGITANYNSTGSRVSLKDYSGEYLSDRKLRALSPGLFTSYQLHRFSNSLSLTVCAEMGVIFTGMKVVETLVIGDDLIDNYNASFRAFNLYAGPSLRLGYNIISNISLDLNAGYIVQFNGGYFKPEDDDTYTGSYKTRPDWTGLRCGLTLAISIP